MGGGGVGGVTLEAASQLNLLTKYLRHLCVDVVIIISSGLTVPQARGELRVSPSAVGYSELQPGSVVSERSFLGVCWRASSLQAGSL